MSVCNKYSDEEINNYINQVFERYDFNRDNCLSPHQLASLFNEIFSAMGYSNRVQGDLALHIFDDVDKDHNGRVTRDQVFIVFKKLLAM